MRPRVLLLIPAILAVGACTGDTTPPTLGSGDGAPLTASVTFETAAGDVTADFLDLADTDEERARGLMGVTKLDENDGMLFAYDHPTSGAFWMKDTLIPLSIAFIGGDGTVHTIREMTPCRKDPCETYPAKAPFVYALEMNEGWFDRNGVEVGDAADVRLLTY
jgi:uncharacterized membrane protein (UPF0127 family)